jgi:hypothetical protein
MARRAYWQIKLISVSQYYAQLGGGKSCYISSAHCRACALVTLLIKHGGDVDLRGGWDRSSPCYQMLAITVRGARDDDAGEERSDGK